MILALALACCVEAVVHRTPVEKDGTFMYWTELPGVQPMPDRIKGLWNQRDGWFRLKLDPGVRLTRIRRFAASDIGSTFEGDLIPMTLEGRHLAQTAPHKERPFENYNGWFDSNDPEYTVPFDRPEILLRWVCRVTGPWYDNMTLQPLSLDPKEAQTRCHFGIEISAKEMR